MANLLADAQKNFRNFGRIYKTVRSNDERLREPTNEAARESANDANGQVNPASVLIDQEHNKMNSGLDSHLLAVLQTFDDHLSISVGSSRNTFLDTLFDKNSVDEDDEQIESRGSSYVAPAADVGNVGNAVLYICGTDSNNDVIESCTIELLEFKALGSSDSRAGLGNETYSVQGSGKDQRSEFLAGGKGTKITGLTAIGGGRSTLITNASFDLAFNGSGSTKLRNWEITAGNANVARVTTPIAQDRGGSHAALEITGDCIIRFDFRKQNVPLSYLAPFIAGIFVELAAVTADVEVRLGSVGTPYLDNQSHVAATQVYTPQTLDPDTPNAWRKVYDTDGNPFLEFEVSNYVGGTIRLDDSFCEQMTFRGGRWVSVVSGTTITVEGDKHTQECTLPVNSAGQVDYSSGAAGDTIDSITIDGVELLDEPVVFVTNLATTLAIVEQKINERRTFPNYTAIFDTIAIITLTQEIPATGTLAVVAGITDNGGGLSVVPTDVSGAGAVGERQDALVRRTGKYLPHASVASATWEDHA